jgi:hypothetical protein
MTQAQVSKNAQATSYLQDTAVEIEGLSKVKAINMADKLVESIETDYFKLGGVLSVIQNNAWYEGFETFDLYVYEKFGFKVRKAHYLMDIYGHLVGKQIDWEKVKGLGWTKLKDLAAILTPENTDEWVEKASKCTVIELQAMLKAGTTGEGAEKQEVTDQVTKMTFKFHSDQAETVSTALNKAKAECSTDFDTVALEMICAGFLAGNSHAAPVAGESAGDLKAQMAVAGWEQTLIEFSEMFPQIDLKATLPE